MVPATRMVTVGSASVMKMLANFLPIDRKGEINGGVNETGSLNPRTRTPETESPDKSPALLRQLLEVQHREAQDQRQEYREHLQGLLADTHLLMNSRAARPPPGRSTGPRRPEAGIPSQSNVLRLGRYQLNYIKGSNHGM